MNKITTDPLREALERLAHPQHLARSHEATASWTLINQDDCWVERRRPGTAPGEGERVDPEPRLQDGEQ